MTDQVSEQRTLVLRQLFIEPTRREKLAWIVAAGGIVCGILGMGKRYGAHQRDGTGGQQPKALVHHDVHPLLARLAFCRVGTMRDYAATVGITQYIA